MKSIHQVLKTLLVLGTLMGGSSLVAQEFSLRKLIIVEPVSFDAPFSRNGFSKSISSGWQSIVYDRPTLVETEDQLQEIGADYDNAIVGLSVSPHDGGYRATFRLAEIVKQSGTVSLNNVSAISVSVPSGRNENQQLRKLAYKLTKEIDCPLEIFGSRQKEDPLHVLKMIPPGNWQISGNQFGLNDTHLSYQFQFNKDSTERSALFRFQPPHRDAPNLPWDEAICFVDGEKMHLCYRKDERTIGIDTGTITGFRQQGVALKGSPPGEFSTPKLQTSKGLEWEWIPMVY